MPATGRFSTAAHWYSDTPLTVMLVRAALTLVVGVQEPSPATAPHLTVAVVADRSVAKFTVIDVPTASLRYGYLRSGTAVAAVAGVATTATRVAPSTSAGTVAPKHRRHVMAPALRPGLDAGIPTTRGLLTPGGSVRRRRRSVTRGKPSCAGPSGWR